MGGNGWKWPEMAERAWNAWKLLKWSEMTGYGLRWLEMAKNGWKWLTVAEMTGNGWK